MPWTKPSSQTHCKVEVSCLPASTMSSYTASCRSRPRLFALVQVHSNTSQQSPSSHQPQDLIHPAGRRTSGLPQPRLQLMHLRPKLQLPGHCPSARKVHPRRGGLPRVTPRRLRRSQTIRSGKTLTPGVQGGSRSAHAAGGLSPVLVQAHLIQQIPPVVWLLDGLLLGDAPAMAGTFP